MTADRRHPSAERYDPFVDTRGPVGHGRHFLVERIPGARPGEPARFRKTVQPGIGDELLPLLHRENLLLLEMAQLRMAHVAQPLAFERDSPELEFVVTTEDAGPSLNLWTRHAFAPLTEPGAPARPWLDPAGWRAVMEATLKALAEFHARGFVHGDIHAGNLCIPFARHLERPEAVRALTSRLKLIDFGHTLSRRQRFAEPLPLDPDAPEAQRRVSPALRRALRLDAQGGRADAVFALDGRVDLYAGGALGAQLLGALEWRGHDAAALHPAMSACVDALLALDSDGTPMPAGLHEGLIARLATLPEPASGGAWLIPQGGRVAASTAPESARETPLVVGPRAGAGVAAAGATPLGATAAAPPATPAAGPRPPPEPPPSPASLPIPPEPPPRRRRSMWPWVLSLALLAGAGWWGWQRTRAPAAPAQAAAPAEPPLSAPDVEERLQTLVHLAGAGRWAQVDGLVAELARRAATPDQPASGAAATELATGLEEVAAGRYDAASASLRRATQAAPRAAAAWSALGYATLRQGDPDGAREPLQRALRLKPADAAAWAHLAEIDALAGQTDAADAQLRLAVFLSRQRARTLEHLRQGDVSRIAPALRERVAAAGEALDRLPSRRTP